MSTAYGGSIIRGPLLPRRLYLNPGEEEIIGLKSPGRREISDKGTNQLTTVKFDTDTYPDGAVLLLKNETGATVVLKNISIYGQLVARRSGEQGIIHDAFADYDRIAVEGERLYEIGNNYIVTVEQTRKIADWWWKFFRSKANRYTLRMAGTYYWLVPGGTYTLQVGGVGEREYINAVCTCERVEITRTATGIGETVAELRVAFRNWIFDSTALARLIASGMPTATQAMGSTIRIGSSTETGICDVYCDGTADQEEIQAAIDVLAEQGGGTVHLGKGTFTITGAIELASNVMLEGEDAGTVVSRNADTYAIQAIGTTTTHLEGCGVRQLLVTRVDTNNRNLCYFKYVDSGEISSVHFHNPKQGYGALSIASCEDIRIIGCSFVDCPLGVSLSGIGGLIANNSFSGYGSTAVYLSGDAVKTKVQGNRIAIASLFDAIVTSGIIDVLNGAETNEISGNMVVGGLKVRYPDSVLCAIRIWSGALRNQILNNCCIDNGNLVEYGSCEHSTNAPRLVGDASADTLNAASYARSSTQKYSGDWSYKGTGNGSGVMRLYWHDSSADLHGLIVGTTYRMIAQVFVPAGGYTPSNVKLFFDDDVATEITGTAATGTDAWEEVQLTFTVATAATIADLGLLVNEAGTSSVYIDWVSLMPLGIHNEHAQHFRDDGTGTSVRGNSWQNPFPA